MPKKFLNKEDESKYVSVHIWLKRHFGKATICEKCDNPKGYRCEWANISGEYKRDRADYMQLCQSCHKKHDHGDTCRNGHKYTPENTRIRRSGNRDCYTCIKLAMKRYLKNKKSKQHGMDKSK